MNNTSDFVIKNGVLTEYKGASEHVIIPNSVTSIEDDPFKIFLSVLCIFARHAYYYLRHTHLFALSDFQKTEIS